MCGLIEGVWLNTGVQLNREGAALYREVGQDAHLIVDINEGGIDVIRSLHTLHPPKGYPVVVILMEKEEVSWRPLHTDCSHGDMLWNLFLLLLQGRAAASVGCWHSGMDWNSRSNILSLSWCMRLTWAEKSLMYTGPPKDTGGEAGDEAGGEAGDEAGEGQYGVW